MRDEDEGLHHGSMVPNAMSPSGTGALLAKNSDRVFKPFLAPYPLCWIEREIENGRAVAAMDLPAPRPIDTMACDGRAGILYERVNGDPILSISKTEPWLPCGIAKTLTELHTRIHAQGGSGFVGLSESLRETIEHGDALSPKPLPGECSLLDRLPDGKKLCHFVFHPDRALMTSSGPVIIDWMTACRGIRWPT